MGVERVGLEHHRDIPVPRPQAGDVPPADVDGAAIGLLDAGDDSHQGGLAAAGRADQRHEFTCRDVQRDAAQDLGGTKTFRD
jgi:hypothetical protein